MKTKPVFKAVITVASVGLGFWLLFNVTCFGPTVVITNVQRYDAVLSKLKQAIQA